MTQNKSPIDLLGGDDLFADRHIGPRPEELSAMLAEMGHDSLDSLTDAVVPESIRVGQALDLPPARSETRVLADLRELAGANRIVRAWQGLGYHECVTPPVIQRCILEDPGWYTAYTPYQAEIAQGRMEALLNFQTMVADLSGMPVANASLLDEATAAAESMTFCRRVLARRDDNRVFFVSAACHPQTIAVVRTRAHRLGIDVEVGDTATLEFRPEIFGVLVQYPATDGRVDDHAGLCERAHEAGALVVVAADLLALTLLRPPATFGADVVIGNSQRFGVPLGFGGPHAAFMATREEFKRQLPGRIVGVTHDADGRPAIRLAMQTREQHISRDRATSNICTAQVLLAVAASMYAVYHGPDGLRRIASRLHRAALTLRETLAGAGCGVGEGLVFDTLRVTPLSSRPATVVLAAALDGGINLRLHDNGDVGVALGETLDATDLARVVAAFTGTDDVTPASLSERAREIEAHIPSPHRRESAFLTHPVFTAHRSETALMRYARRLAGRDLSLTTSMIPLGSCTMKLNAAAEMMPITWPGFAALHPFAPADQTAGYTTLIERLSAWLGEITGLNNVSMMPNAGAQGEYTGLLVIRAWHDVRGDTQRNVCLIPRSAHGTNPASAVMSGMDVVVVDCDAQGNIDVDDLRRQAENHADRLAALMVTYPSTHGVFEASIQEMSAIVHAGGGQVYMDGANMNALVGLCRPVDLGADVCHLNLHKTFCIPHGGGGPGMGPICAAAHLAPFLPRHPLDAGAGPAVGPVSAAPFGSPSILPISYAYIAMMGADGLRRATQVAILNANYIAHRLAKHYPLVYSGRGGLVAHECILDMRGFKKTAGVEAEDIAKRLMDYGFHAPTMSWPVVGTLMVEPTESESKEELDRFCDAMIAIRDEIRQVETGALDRENNPLKKAPHTAHVLAGAWDRPYSREMAGYPVPWLRDRKYWPPVSRIDNVYGDRHLVCTCPPPGAYEEA
ncbi:MAG: aminomethyl-transferring glycine dehydrogenase [Acidobacteriota bacterium]